MQVAVAGFGDGHAVLLAGGGNRRQGLAEEVGDAGRNGVVDQPGEVEGGIGLRVEVDQQGPVALGGTGCRQVAGNAGFANATFLIENHTTHETLIHEVKMSGRGQSYD
ncbi:hypothetical protein D9M68_846500 [compost metagenome]